MDKKNNQPYYQPQPQGLPAYATPSGGGLFTGDLQGPPIMYPQLARYPPGGMPAYPASHGGIFSNDLQGPPAIYPQRGYAPGANPQGPPGVYPTAGNYLPGADPQGPPPPNQNVYQPMTQPQAPPPYSSLYPPVQGNSNNSTPPAYSHTGNLPPRT